MKSDGVRNLRAKTVRPTNIPVKRTSEGIETAKVLSEPTSVSNGSSFNDSNVNPSIFPVKTILKKFTNEIEIQEIDKENIDPFTGAPIQWDDLDAEDSGDPLMVSDYVVEIFDYMKQLEVRDKERNICIDLFIVSSLIILHFRKKLLPVQI